MKKIETKLANCAYREEAKRVRKYLLLTLPLWQTSLKRMTVAKTSHIRKKSQK